MSWAEPVARWIEGAGVAVIVAGGAAATLIFLSSLRERRFLEAYHRYRANLGRAILLGLEFLVAGDIIGTIMVEASLESVAVLAVVVLIRTFLSFSLETEIEGQWPWQRSERKGGSA